MSQENVEAFKRGIEAFHRRDMETMVELHDPSVEWHPMIQVLLGGEMTVYRGHEGLREQLRDLDEAFSEVVDFKHGKAIRAVTYADPKEALEAAGLSE